MSVIIAAAVGLGVWLIRYFNSTLQQIANTFYRLTDGDFRNKIDLHFQDELGDLLRALQGMQLKLNYDLADAREKAANALRVKQALDNVLANVMVAEGDLISKIDNDFGGTFAVCKESINATQEKLGEVFGQIRESSEVVRNSSQEIASGNNNLSHRANEQAASQEETASSTEQLTGMVKTNAHQAKSGYQHSDEFGSERPRDYQ